MYLLLLYCIVVNFCISTYSLFSLCLFQEHTNIVDRGATRQERAKLFFEDLLLKKGYGGNIFILSVFLFLIPI